MIVNNHHLFIEEKSYTSRRKKSYYAISIRFCQKLIWRLIFRFFKSLNFIYSKNIFLYTTSLGGFGKYRYSWFKYYIYSFRRNSLILTNCAILQCICSVHNTASTILHKIGSRNCERGMINLSVFCHWWILISWAFSRWSYTIYRWQQNN